MKKQQGLTLLGLIFFCMFLVLVAILVMKIVPAYIEHHTVQQIVHDSTQGKNTPQEIRVTFDKFADVNQLDALTGKDLKIAKEGNNYVTRYAYTKIIRLGENVRLEIDFSGSSQDQ